MVFSFLQASGLTGGSRLGGGEHEPAVARIPVSGEGSWVRDPSQPKRSSETRAVPGSRSPCPSRSEGTAVRVPYWLPLEHLERRGSVHENKMARIINDPTRQWPWVFPVSLSSLGTASCFFLGG